MSDFAVIEFEGAKLPARVPCKCIQAKELELALTICRKQYGEPARVYHKAGTSDWFFELPGQLDKPAFNMDEMISPTTFNMDEMISPTTPPLAPKGSAKNAAPPHYKNNNGEGE